MGARFRLKASYPLTGYGKLARRVVTAMKRYGLVLADNGSPWYFQGEQNAGWPPALVDELKRIPASAFEAVDTSPLMIKSNPPGCEPLRPIRGRSGPCGKVPFASPIEQIAGLRAVAQLGSALDWGSRGRRFKSCQPDFPNRPWAAETQCRGDRHFE